MAKIYLVGGEKGGVGKSLVSRTLAQYMIDRDIKFLGFDTDRSHGALLRFYSGYASPVVVDRYEALDAIMEAAVEDPDRNILVDLAAQTHQPLVKWMEESDVLGLAAESDLEISYWHVMDSGRDSVDLLKNLLDRFQNRLSYVIVLNQLRGNDFSILEKSGELDRAKSLGAQVVRFKLLHETVINKIDGASSSFWAAKNVVEKDKNILGLMERQRLKAWLNEAYKQFESAGVGAND